MKDDLSPVTRDHKLPSLTGREEEQPLRWIVLVNDYRRLGKMPVRGGGHDRIELV
jgi:hypothetical protein